MMTDTLSYEEAFAELQKILTELQNEQTSIDDLATQSQKANALIEYCRNKLRGIEESIDSISL